MQIYVDDPVYSASGTLQVRRNRFTIALLWAAALGFPIAWAKASGGLTIEWIGASLSIAPEAVRIAIPEDKCRSLADETAAVCKKPWISLKQLRSIAGRYSFFAGLVVLLRPFLQPLFEPRFAMSIALAVVSFSILTWSGEKTLDRWQDADPIAQVRTATTGLDRAWERSVAVYHQTFSTSAQDTQAPDKGESASPDAGTSTTP